MADEDKGRILVVDDIPTNLKVLTAILHKQGYSVRSAVNGTLALHVAQTEPLDLVLLDVNMPEMDGFEVCRRLKSNPHTRDIPVIFISALSHTADKVKAFSVGGVDYVAKPFEFAEIIARVDSQITLYRQRREIEENQRFIQRVTNAVPDVIYIFDFERRTSIFNNRSLFHTLGYPSGYLPDEGAESFTSLLHPDDGPRLQQRQAGLATAQDGQIVETEFRMRASDGHYRWFLARDLVFKRHPNGSPSQVLGTAQDITERKEAEQQALALRLERERIRLLSDFIRDASHDFRTPLAVINTSAYLLGKLTDPGKLAEHRTKIVDQVSHIAQLLEKMLMAARLETEAPYNFAPVAVNRLLRQIVGRVSGQVHDKRQIVELDLAASLPIINAEEGRLELALFNLIENAVEYTPPEGTITIRTAARDSMIAIEVSDTGRGIAAADLPYIFESFYRSDPARSRSTGGSGLGLAMARRIVELHHGLVQAESMEGKGSTFRVLLPVENPEQTESLPKP